MVFFDGGGNDNGGGRGSGGGGDNDNGSVGNDFKWSRIYLRVGFKPCML